MHTRSATVGQTRTKMRPLLDPIASAGSEGGGRAGCRATWALAAAGRIESFLAASRVLPTNLERCLCDM